MSEIYDQLKRMQIRKRGDLAAVTVDRVEIPEEHDSDAERAETTTPVGNKTPDKVNVAGFAQFDLSSADRRIKSVLDPLTLGGEQFRLLRTKLGQLQKKRGVKVLLVTSSIPSEGKTFSACCLAGVFAQEPGKRVLLMDGDLRKPQAGEELGWRGDDQDVGLSRVLRGEIPSEQAIVKAGEGGLFLMPAGPVPQDPAELLSSPRLEATIRKMAENFDWVIIDSPPAVGMTDAAELAPLSDAVLLVVQAEKTPAKIIKQAIRQIGQERICGIVMNRMKRLKHSRYYYSYYHKGSRAKN